MAVDAAVNAVCRDQAAAVRLCHYSQNTVINAYLGMVHCYPMFNRS